MLKLHIFNPEHDLALACNQWQYTPPKVARQLRNDLCWIPAIWAETGDFVFVDDIRYAVSSLSVLEEQLGVKFPAVRFIARQSSEFKELTSFKSVANRTGNRIRLNHVISTWGWDRSVIMQLFGSRIEEGYLVAGPNEMEKDQFVFREQWVRVLSSRQYWRTLLQDHVDEVKDRKELIDSIKGHGGKVVLKTPWSSSGRGVRFVDLSQSSSFPGISFPCLVEPYHNKVQDFAMEFEVSVDGSVHYLGLNLFQTKGSAYIGNVLADEREKEQILYGIMPDINLKFWRLKIEKIIKEHVCGRYVGPLGVDFVLARNNLSEGVVEDKIQVCELNLRRTMGHVALALSHYVKGSMAVEFDGHYYHLSIKNKRPENQLSK
jgi:hypothetical protein